MLKFIIINQLRYYCTCDLFLQSSSPEDQSQCDDLISQLLSEEDIRELAESHSGLCREINLTFIFILAH